VSNTKSLIAIAITAVAKDKDTAASAAIGD
jgi:hypothetical protein